MRRREDGGLSIEVRDTGIGMPEEQAPRRLEPFARRRFRHAHAAGHRPGLTLTKRMAEAHGSMLRISRRPGAGSLVALDFPPNAPWRPPGKAASLCFVYFAGKPAQAWDVGLARQTGASKRRSER